METKFDPMVDEAPHSFRDKISSVDDQGHRVFFHPKKIKGRFYKYRTYVSWFLLTLLFASPHVKINGHPFMMFNILERKFILFGFAFWPEDFSVLVLAAISFVLFIVLFTVVYGRLFCGWICPQTIFMEMVFRKIEYWIDGDAGAQKRLKTSPWNADKIKKRSLKFVVFFIISFLIANTFLAYIIGSDALLNIITDAPSNHKAGLASITIFTGVFFFVYWWFREQACLIVCPYGRLQGVLLDKNSIQVSYDYVRGESRNKLIKNRPTTAGDCIDCNKCVAVCPTGIDIRNGSQLECINCTACMDACDEVMSAVNKPSGLIRYASENAIAAGTKKLFNPRVLGYSLVLSVILTILSYLLVTRPSCESIILLAKGQLLTENKGYYSNLYTIQTVNKTFSPRNLHVEVIGTPGAIIRMVGAPMNIPPDGIFQGAFFIDIPKGIYRRPAMDVTIVVIENGKIIEKVKSSFNGPQ